MLRSLATKIDNGGFEERVFTGDSGGRHAQTALLKLWEASLMNQAVLHHGNMSMVRRPNIGGEHSFNHSAGSWSRT